MTRYQKFIFENYRFDPANKFLELRYSLDGEVGFTETYRFNFDFTNYDQAVLDRALNLLFLMAGVSYYKTYLPPEIVTKASGIDQLTGDFLTKTWQNGLGEFFYVNKLDPLTPITFPRGSSKPKPLEADSSGLLIGIGGGKDSLTSVELLRDNGLDIATWSLDHRSQLAPQAERIGLKHYFVEREWDRKLLELNKQGALNGHVPISAIIAAVGVVVAVLTGRRDVIVSNEQSANEPTLTYQNVAINHQYSKSQAFERDFQNWLKNNFNASLRYYSLLRPLNELRIAEIFSKIAFHKYHDVFSSCNRAFTHASDHLFWDGICPKCAFIFLVLTPFIERAKVEKLFNGKNLLLDPALEPTYRQLLGIEGDKPLECVGEIKESRAAMRLATQKYSELAQKYQFELPDDYDYKELSSDELPAEIRQIIIENL